MKAATSVTSPMSSVRGSVHTEPPGGASSAVAGADPPVAGADSAVAGADSALAATSSPDSARRGRKERTAYPVAARISGAATAKCTAIGTCSAVRPEATSAESTVPRLNPA